MTKNPYLRNALTAGCFAALSGCSTAQLAPVLPTDSMHNSPEVPMAKPSLVGILWKMAITEKEAQPKQILPYFGINEVPAVKMVREGYGWFSLTHQPPRFVDQRLQGLGIYGLFYSYDFDRLPTRERDYYGVRLTSDNYCVSAAEVIAVFGQVFKRLPARVRTAAVAITNVQSAASATNSPTATEKGSLHFESGLFDGRGSITFQFDSQPCADLISINYTRKNQ